MTKQRDARVGYKKLKIYQLAHDLGLRIHRMTLDLPKFEMFEEGSQIRRSSKSVSSNVVEGYSLRKYKAKYIHYLFRAHASSMETVEHLEYLYETDSLKDADLFRGLMASYSELNSMSYGFIKAVDREHNPDILSQETTSI